MEHTSLDRVLINAIKSKSHIKQQLSLKVTTSDIKEHQILYHTSIQFSPFRKETRRSANRKREREGRSGRKGKKRKGVAFGTMERSGGGGIRYQGSLVKKKKRNVNAISRLSCFAAATLVTAANLASGPGDVARRPRALAVSSLYCPTFAISHVERKAISYQQVTSWYCTSLGRYL